jgi:hypothetical protein
LSAEVAGQAGVRGSHAEFALGATRLGFANDVQIVALGEALSKGLVAWLRVCALRLSLRKRRSARPKGDAGNDELDR